MFRIALVLEMLAAPAMAADVLRDSGTNTPPVIPTPEQGFITPPLNNLLISAQGAAGPTLVITKEGIVTNGAGIPLDELAPADQIAVMCEAMANIAKSYAGVTVTRCGKP